MTPRVFIYYFIIPLGTCKERVIINKHLGHSDDTNLPIVHYNNISMLNVLVMF